MRFKINSIFLICILLCPGIVLADLTGTSRIKSHADNKLEGLDIKKMSEDSKKDLLVSPIRLNLNMIIPVYGSYILDNSLYGNVRPPAIIFDWTLGGFIPLAMMLAAGIGRGSISLNRKKVLIYAAVSLYILTRVAVIITINEHIHNYNKYMKNRLNLDRNSEIVDIGS